MLDCLTVFSQLLIIALLCSVLSTSNVDIVNVYIYFFYKQTFQLEKLRQVFSQNCLLCNGNAT